MKRIHNTSNPSLEWEDRDEDLPNNIFKPFGLWYAIGTEWIEWAEQNMEGRVYEYNYEIKINPEKVLVIDNRIKFLEFHNKYKVVAKYYSYKLDWEKIKQEYSGIEIAPYQWEFRLGFETMWYYPWDVASGCIWRRDGVIDICKVSLDNYS